VQSNALAALEAIDTEVAEKVLAEGCVTGDRINGLCDGVTGPWWGGGAPAPGRGGGAAVLLLDTCTPPHLTLLTR